MEKVKEYIYAGDVFEVNLAQRFKCIFSNKNSTDLYLKLRDSNPAPFSAYVNIGETTILSSSPERFIKLENNKIEARPIKGTIKRSMLDFDDRKLAKTLQQSPKDRAENIMIVDLMRNDLSRVAIPSSVSVDILCGLETYTNVHHLVSVITAELKHNHDSISLLQTCFPGGSITGAPKIRVMEIIDELEPQRRGPYCGSLGYIGGNGNLDLSILIRSIVIKGDNLTFHSGGAITLDSDPEQEWNETLLKAESLKTILKA